MKRFITVLISVGLLAGLIGCSDSSDEIAELRAELDATRAELTELISTKADYSEKEEYKDKDDDGLEVSYEETVDFFTICFDSSISKQECGYAWIDVIALRMLVPNDEYCRTQILRDAIYFSAFPTTYDQWANSRHVDGPDDAYLFTPPRCVGLDN